MKHWLHTIGTIAFAALTTASPAIQGLLGNHPKLATAFVTAWAILGHLLPSLLQNARSG